MRKARLRRVAILCPASTPWIAPCLGGIRRYAHKQGGWHLFSSPLMLHGGKELALTLRSMRGWKGDGIIASTNDEGELRQIQRMGIPAVNLASGLSKTLGIPRVLVDNFQAGRLAADHLLSRGVQHLAYFGWRGVWYSEQRRLGFSRRAAEAGVECACSLQPFAGRPSRSWMEHISVVARWVASLPRPSGVFAVSDYRAQLLMEACHEAGLRIPNDIAVVGMDNDETICEHSVPTLTSISRNSEQVGWEVAALLDRMMQGEPPPDCDILLEPDGVVTRQSTDMLYCGEPVVQCALDYMRLHLKTQFNIEQIAVHAGVSRRTLETRFRETLHSSPHNFLTGLRVQHARALMQMPQKRTIAQTAFECGFGTAPAFYTAFRRIVGETPGSYRRKLLSDNAKARSV